MLRDPSFLDQVSEDHRKMFVDGRPIAPAKLKVLKEMIKKRFEVSSCITNNFSSSLRILLHNHNFFEQWLCISMQKYQVKYYNVEYLGKNERTNLPELGGLDGGSFSKEVSFRKQKS